MTITAAQLRAIGQGQELRRLQSASPSQSRAIYQGMRGRSHKVLVDGRVHYVSQKNVIARGALIVGAPVSLVNGMLDTVNSPHVQS
ncbi:MAG: hypothetical protein AAF889_08005 [Cyanobacteria bacterium P01_D01_bin.73]